MDSHCFNAVPLAARQKLKFTELWEAMRAGDYHLANQLICNGAYVNEIQRTIFDPGTTLLHYAAMRGDVPLTAFELLPNEPSCGATAKAIIREAVKREVLGQTLCEGYKITDQSCEKYLKIDQKCRAEVEHMRSERIDVEDNSASFFYIFSKKEEKLVPLATNENIVKAFETSDYLTSFRIYAVDLTTNFQMAKKRANFVMSVEDCLVERLSGILPAPIVRKIAAYVKK